MQAFFNDHQLKADLIAQLEWHRQQDMIVAGHFWNGESGCSVGCGLHSLAKIKGIPIRDFSNHEQYAALIDIPAVLMYLNDNIFESLPYERQQTWPIDFISAIPVGADLSLVWPKFWVWQTFDPTYGIIQYATGNSKLAIEHIGHLYQRIVDGQTVSDDEWGDAADAAAYAYAAYAAYAAAADAAYAADADADAAARLAQADKILELMRNA